MYEMKKVLFIATVVRKHILVFHIPYLQMLREAGYETYVASANDTDNEIVEIPYCDHYVEINFKRNPLHPGNLLAYRQLKKLIRENHFDIIHCHTPVGGLLGRLTANRTRKRGTKVFYTAHGFHFYKGAPLKNWLLYYPVEKLCARFTDKLITINSEDYALAQKKMKAKEVFYVPGVGVDISKFENVQVDRETKRKEIGVPENAFLLISVGELSMRKNHQVVLKAISNLKDSNIHYAIAGTGNKKDYLLGVAKELGVSNRLHLLGYRRDIAELYKAADLCCLPSVHEGLPVAVMEAMACGLPCVVSKIRGNVDLIDKNGGFESEFNDATGFADAIIALNADPELRKSMGEYNSQRSHMYDICVILQKMKEVYELE